MKTDVIDVDMSAWDLSQWRTAAQPWIIDVYCDKIRWDHWIGSSVDAEPRRPDCTQYTHCVPCSGHFRDWQNTASLSSKLKDHSHTSQSPWDLALGDVPTISPLMGTLKPPIMGTLKPESNGPKYSNTVTGTLAVDWWAATFGTAKRGLGGLWKRPVPSSLYQMQQPTHQRPVYQLASYYSMLLCYYEKCLLLHQGGVMWSLCLSVCLSVRLSVILSVILWTG